MAKVLISDLIPLLKQPGLMLEMEEEREKLLNFFAHTHLKLADAEIRAERDPILRTWLVDLEAVVHDADDIVYDFTNAKLQAEAEAEDNACGNRIGDKVRACLFSCFKISCFNLPFFNEPTLSSGALQGIKNRIVSVFIKIDDLVDMMPAPNSEITTAAERQHKLLFPSPTEIGSIFVGRDEQKESIVKLLLQADDLYENDYRYEVDYPYVTFICGPQGIGKTALAKFVCNDASINKHFECVLWVELRSEFNIGIVIKNLIDQIIGKDCCISEDEIDLLEHRLVLELNNRGCIVVLDDVGTDHTYIVDHLVKSLYCTIIVTTSYYEVEDKLIRSMINNLRCEVKPLESNYAWNLFCNKAFSDAKCPGILKEMGDEIIFKCGGSPLAVKMMGCLMRFKKEPHEWQAVINQLNICIGYELIDELEEYTGGAGDVDVETIIRVCYDDLCSQVKQCFAFCSLFPKGHYMDKEILIKLWMANGLLPTVYAIHKEKGNIIFNESMPPEEKGNIIFNELVSRNFIEDVKSIHEDYPYGNKHGYQSRVTCKMLGLIHRQAVVAAREFALKILDLSCQQTVVDIREFSLETPYLLSITGGSPIDIPVLLETNPGVHMLLFPDGPFIRTVNCSAVPETNSLRGMHLRCALFERNLLDLKHMRHLRYLDLSGSRVKTLPEVTSLYFLQTLNLSKCFLLYQLPKNMKYMTSLRHLYINKCPKLKKMPAHFRQLINLRTLTTYIVGETNVCTGIDEIKDLQLGGLLELYNLRKVKTPTIAKEANLVSKTNLNGLTLCWGREQLVMSKENNDLEVLENLQPHDGLNVLKVQQYGGREFATWLACLSKLVELHLFGCSQCKTLPAVCKLPSLKVLCLKHMPSLICMSHTDEFKGRRSVRQQKDGKYKISEQVIFPKLETLILVDLKRLERWNEGEPATSSNHKATSEKVTLPKLVEMEITSCPNMKTLPFFPQLKRITTSIENYRLLQAVTYLITQSGSLVEEANIAKASNGDYEPFPALGASNGDNQNLKIMRMDSTNSLFMPTTLPRSSPLDLWRPLKWLEYLDIFNCNSLKFWPLEFRYLKVLRRLSIRMCPNLTGEIRPEEKQYEPKDLQQLEFYECRSLKMVPAFIQLNTLELDECPEVESVSGIKGLAMLYLSCTSWTSLPSVTLDTLGTLWVSECYSLTSLSDVAKIDRLNDLVINECPMVKDLPESLNNTIKNLNKLQISKCPDLEKFCKKPPYSDKISKIGKSTEKSPSAN